MPFKKSLTMTPPSARRRGGNRLEDRHLGNMAGEEPIGRDGRRGYRLSGELCVGRLLPADLFRAIENTGTSNTVVAPRSEEHTSELQSQSNLVCRLLLEKKKKIKQEHYV